MNNFNQSIISHRNLLHFFQLLFCFALTSCKGGCSGGVFKSNPDDNSLTHASSNPPSTTPGGLDFKTRCQDPSVVKCVSFDTPDDFKNGSGGTNGAFGYNSGIIPPSGTADYSRATMDSAVKASGTGSLKFTIPSNSGADTSGAYFTNFSEDLSLQFDGGSEFYIQWRQRFSPEFITTVYDGGGGFKQIIVGTGDKVGTTYSSCTSLELPVYNHLQKGFPVMYNSCTGSTSHGPYDGFYEPYDAYDFKLQNARAMPGCLYSQSATGYFPPNGNCFGYFANEWMTFQMHVQLGPRVGDEFKNSYVTLWMAREGKPSELVINWGPYNLSAGSSTENERFGKVWLLPYNTGKSAAQTHPTAYTWYDDLIISRSKIPDPTMSSSSNALAEESMPSWRQGQMVGEWREISGSALSLSPMLVKTYPSLGANGPSSKVTAWTGFSIDTRDSAVYSAANGGHGDYAGNEVNRISLLDNTPKWIESKPSSAVADVILDASHYADGRPTSRHSYYGSFFNELRGRAMVLGGSRFGDGYVTPTMDGFNITTKDWDAAHSFPNVPADFGGTQAGAVAGDAQTGNIYTFANWNIQRWNNSANTWSEMLTNTTVYGQGSATALDTKRQRILIVSGDNPDHGYYDLNTNTVTNISLSGPNASALTGNGNGMIYEPILDKYLFTKGSANPVIYRIDPETFYVDTLTSIGGAAIPSTTNGVWTRFLFVPQLKGIVYFPTYDGNFWFLRTN